MVTIADVARHAGVSVSTVSYTLSGKRPISASTRERIARSVAELGYRPNATAQALASKRTNTLALMAPLRADNNVPVIMQFVAGIAAAARDHDHDILLLTQSEGVEGVRRVRETALVDAVIVMDIEADDARLPVLRALGLPAVLIGTTQKAGGLVWVDLDFARAAEACVEHLVELGHGSVLMLGSPGAVYERRSGYALAFAAGFESAVRRHGIDGRWCPSEPAYQAASALLERELAKRPRPTALVVHNEGILGAVLGTLRRLDLRVPEDISVVALCPEQTAVNQVVELTGVAVPAEQIGRAAVEMVLRQVDGDGTAQTRLIAPELTIRQSTAARHA
ncbi:LacI family DNA-binding transcriptional regulator [Dactylosporangium sp. NPDC000244]|uniref:LacI family DNA-binding transcriptional regulator n=1 Tax=Dactylosporangium sp. NPDC000244 TaxID=3154365 RepID=UPI003316A314